MAGIRYNEEDPANTDMDLVSRELLVTGKGRKQRIVRFGRPAERAIDRCIRRQVPDPTDHGDPVPGAGAAHRVGEETVHSGMGCRQWRYVRW